MGRPSPAQSRAPAGAAATKRHEERRRLVAKRYEEGGRREAAKRHKKGKRKRSLISSFSSLFLLRTMTFVLRFSLYRSSPSLCFSVPKLISIFLPANNTPTSSLLTIPGAPLCASLWPNFLLLRASLRPILPLFPIRFSWHSLSLCLSAANTSSSDSSPLSPLRGPPLRQGISGGPASPRGWPGSRRALGGSVPSRRRPAGRRGECGGRAPPRPSPAGRRE